MRICLHESFVECVKFWKIIAIIMYKSGHVSARKLTYNLQGFRDHLYKGPVVEMPIEDNARFRHVANFVVVGNRQSHTYPLYPIGILQNLVQLVAYFVCSFASARNRVIAAFEFLELPVEHLPL